ncbi:unnamed protein product [Urochloa humidicola]
MDDDEYSSTGSDGDGDYTNKDMFDLAADSMCCGRYGYYVVLTEEAIRKEVTQQAAFTAEVLSVPADWALALLLHYQWCAYDVMFYWDSDQDAVRHAVGLPAAGDTVPALDNKDGEETVTCGICLEVRPTAATATAGCAHRYCHHCWRGYIAAAVAGGGASRCLVLRCPDPSCRRAVLRGTVERFTTGAYDPALTRSYAGAHGATGTLRPCPAAGCGCAIKKIYAGSHDGGDVFCRCGAGFCWSCGGAPHWPASCAAAAARGAGDAEAATAAWLAVHAKPCPRCRRLVGRPDGAGDGGWCCGSVVCAPPCAYRFCWRCLCNMADPNRPRISHYDCPEIYETAAGGAAEEEQERRRERARRALEGFLRYDDMWEKSMAVRRSAEGELRWLREGGGLGKLGLKWGVMVREVEFVEEAWARLAEGRRVVGNVCLFARTMQGVDEDEDGRRRRDLLEFQLGKADDILGRLQRCVEEGPAGKDLEEFSYEVRNLACVAREYVHNFAKAVGSGEVGKPPSTAKTRSGTLEFQQAVRA